MRVTLRGLFFFLIFFYHLSVPSFSSIFSFNYYSFPFLLQIMTKKSLKQQGEMISDLGHIYTKRHFF
ncbi:hypothetical protein BDV29DRAFT_7553 [Aspergillus leporis]|uniref:Uncharacterized protein n=1 Tax=Aspergillus leporis TaxID=41062 RepID=A0A5N5WV32_9EURO|nr:hypothetical protein BDV29DRAFT_7553 [Aspergillus leporis]